MYYIVMGRIYEVMYRVFNVVLLVMVLKSQYEMEGKLDDIRKSMYIQSKGVKDNIDFLYTYFTIQRFI